MADFFDPELDLLGDDLVPGDEADAAANHALRTAPLITGDAYEELGHKIFPQRALYGRIVSQHSSRLPEHPRSAKVYINTNAPFSALVCGVQGSGKSHSTSVLLESCLMKDERIGTLPAPLSALVFHYDTAAGGGLVQPCEAAYLSAVDRTRSGDDVVPPKVTVLVVPTYVKAMRKVYAGLPRVTVEPLLFAPDDISGERLLAMMKVDDNTQMPLYMESIMAILRSMEDNFDYKEFRQQLAGQRFNGSQKAMLNLRLALLDSCLTGGNTSNRVKNHFRQGQLTIIDLSSPFMDGTSACGFFDIILGLFVESEVGASGKLVVLDEAHKYLSESQTGSSARLTESLLTVIRQQRHLATRVVVSTQEPTVVPSKFLDLCSIIIAHRFSSPKWLRVLAQHVSAADSSLDELFEKIVSLQTGQAIVFAPNGLGVRSSSVAVSAHTQADTEAELHRTPGPVVPLGQGYLILRSRLRLTLDGGHSLLAVSTPGMSTRLGRVSGRADAVHADTTTSFPSTIISAVSSAPVVVGACADVPLPLRNQSVPKSQNASMTSQPITTSLPATRNDCGTDFRASLEEVVEVVEDTSGMSKPTLQNPNVGTVEAVRKSASSAISPLSSAILPTSEPSPVDTHPDKVDADDEQMSRVRGANLVEEESSMHMDGTQGQNNPVLFDETLEKTGTVTSLASGYGDSVDPATCGVAVPSRPVAPDHAHPRVVIHLTGDKERFIPLIKYLQVKASSAVPVVMTKNIRRKFRRKYPEIYGDDPSQIAEIIHSAVNLDLLVKLDETHVKLKDNATYIFDDTAASYFPVHSIPLAAQPSQDLHERSGGEIGLPNPVVPSNQQSCAEDRNVHITPSPSNSPDLAALETMTRSSRFRVGDIIRLDGHARSFAPLVQCVQVGTQHTLWMNKKRIKKHFKTDAPDQYGTEDTALDTIIHAAIQAGYLEPVFDKSVRLVGGAKYVF